MSFIVLTPKSAAKIQKNLERVNALLADVYAQFEGQAPAAPKAKRGRKPSKKVKAEKPAEATPPAKRGRPPKVAVAAEAEL